MSFRIEAGESVAVVGLNGSGKSRWPSRDSLGTNQNAGSILVEGQDIRQFGPEPSRHPDLVPQDPVLFNETIRENLLTGIRERLAKT